MDENNQGKAAKDAPKHHHHHHGRRPSPSALRPRDPAPDDRDGHTSSRHHHKHHKKKSGNQLPHSEVRSQELGGNISESPRAEEVTNTIPVTLETVDDNECPPQPISFLEAQYGDYAGAKGKNTPLTNIPVSVRDRDDATSSQHNSPETMDDNVQSNGQDSAAVPLKSPAWRSILNLFNSRNRQVNNEMSNDEAEPSAEMRTGEAASSDIARNDSISTMDGNCENMLLPENIDYVIPMATLVEENTDTRYKKWKLIALIVAASIIAIGIGVGVAASGNKATPVSQGKGEGGNTKTVLPEDIQEKYNYTQWFCPYEAGGVKVCFGFDCNVIGLACSSCGLYGVQIDTNEVFGACSHCSICAGGGLEADCTNLGYGTFNFNCLDEEEVQHAPEGYNNYTYWTCFYEMGGRALCAGVGDCNTLGFPCSSCGVYEVQIDTNEVVGACSYCNLCAGGGIDAECMNIGYGKFNCYFPEDE